MDGPRLTRYPTTDGKEGWAKEVGDMVMPASSDEVAMWKENERLRQLLAEYGRHAEGCSAAHGARYRCRCGWRDMEAEFK
jgi:hypothetical protein